MAKQEQHREYLPVGAQAEFLGIPVIPRPAPDVPIRTPDLRYLPSPDAYVWPGVIAELQSALREVTSAELTPMQSAGHIAADISIACHKAATKKYAPGQAAHDLAGHLSQSQLDPAIRNISFTEKGFVNIELDRSIFAGHVLGQIESSQEHYGEINIGNGDTVVIDCSSPNVAKYMSAAHLRSTARGESLHRMYEAAGYTSIRDNHLGDWGTNLGMLGRALELWGNEYKEKLEGNDPVKGLYELYVRIHEEIKNEKGPDGKGVSRLEEEGKAWFARLEAGDETYQKIMDWVTPLSIEEFHRVYALMGVSHEYTIGESAYFPMLDDVVRVLLERGIAHEVDGAISIPVNGEELVIQRSDQASLYATRDLAGLVAREAWFHPAKILYVVGAEQKFYFSQLFESFRRLTGGNNAELVHVSFGMLKLEGGVRMSTRRGNVIFLEDVLKEAIERVKGIMNGPNRTLPADADIETIARQVGVGAVMFAELGQAGKADVNFSMDRALAFDGKSAPYIQYAHVRAQSILRNAAKAEAFITTDELEFESPEEWDLLKHLSQFSMAIAEAVERNEPSLVAQYTLKAADLFSKFYTNTPAIMYEKDDVVRSSRLRLTAAAAQVMQNGLYLLGIETPVAM